MVHEMDVLSYAKEHGFSEPEVVEGRASIWSIFNGKRQVCGIYILFFKNGQHYAGQSVNIPMRYVQHRENHDDIIQISYKEVPRDRLSAVEQLTIGELERLTSLRNISLVSIPPGVSDIDAIFPVEDQQKWLKGNYVNKHSQRMVNPEFRLKYTKKFNKLMEDKRFVTQIIPVMQKYFKLCIPEPKLTELDFWRCSCLPLVGDGSVIYSRVNIYMQEVLTVGYDNDENIPLFSFHLMQSRLDEMTQIEIDKLVADYPSAIFDEHSYKTGGADQLNICLENSTEALAFLDEPIIMQSIKEFNLRLMRKGAGFNKSSHCMDLADLLVN